LHSPIFTNKFTENQLISENQKNENIDGGSATSDMEIKSAIPLSYSFGVFVGSYVV
jgi:hypothetical protein